MIDVYEKIPVLECGKFFLREICETDAEALLKVYSDERAVPPFNSDNCVDNFHYTTVERMLQTIGYWKTEYKKRYYVRWAVVERGANEAIGTVELFNRGPDEYFNNCGILRLDLRGDFEKHECIAMIVAVLTERAYGMFGCTMIATKAIPAAAERIRALEGLGFALSEHCFVGRGGERYGSYYIKEVSGE